MSEEYKDIPREEVIRGRYERRIEKRDKRIQALEKRVQELEHIIAHQKLDVSKISKNVAKEVEYVLCNVRLIPVGGLNRTKQIVEVKDA